TAWSSTIPASGTPSAATSTTENDTLVANSNAGAGGFSSSSQAYNLALSTSTTDRCLGSSPTGVAGEIFQLRLVNNTGGSLSGVKINYDIRRFTSVSTANELPGYWLFYSIDNGSTWNNVSALNPVISGGTVNVPSTVGVTTVSPTTINFAASVAAGAEIRF